MAAWLRRTEGLGASPALADTNLNIAEDEVVCPFPLPEY
jgi:hypothetical protein